MKNCIHNRATTLSGFLSLVAVGVCFLPMMTLAAPAKSATPCNFTRNLELGVTGDDVLCLQKYLNANGYQIAATGAGSPGRETGEYKALTEAAVIKWQKANKLAPAIGYFGAQSRLFFKSGGTSVVASAGTPAVNAPLIQVPAVASVTDPDAALRAQVEALKAMLEGRAPTVSPAQVTPQTTVGASVTTPVTSTVVTTASGTVATDSSVRSALSSVLGVVAKADSVIRKNGKTSNVSDAKERLATAKDDILTALRAYIAGDYTSAEATLAKAKKNANGAYTEANTATEEQRAGKALSDAQSKYDDAVTEIDEAADDGKTVTSAKRYLKRAVSAIEDIKTALDDESYAEALEAADTARTHVSDALDAIE